MVEAVSRDNYGSCRRKRRTVTNIRWRSIGCLSPIIISALIIILASTIVSAKIFTGFANDFSADDPDQPWIIDADTLRYDNRLQQYVAEGNVTIQRAGIVLRADYIRFDKDALTVTASGNVVITGGEDTFSGSRIDLDLENETGVSSEGYLFLRENNFHIRGRRIEKVGENTYEVENASVTTCDGEDPDWRIEGKYLKVTLEGYGVIKHARMKAGNIPVLYLPYMIFPAKTKRQTGLLLPELGASQRWGYYINQPFFWAINDNTDATFYYHFMSERGHKFGAEYRYNLSQSTGGAWMVDYLNDRKIDDGTGNNSNDWGYPDDDYLRPNKDRYWFRGGHYHTAPLGITGRLEFDVVSDQDYLNEFKEGYSGYDDTEAYFNDTFGRQLDDYLDRVRLNRYNLRRPWSQYSLNVDFRWYDDVINRRFDLPQDTTQRLPFIGFDAAKQRVLTTPVYYDLNSSYNYFYRQDGDDGHRVDLFPRVYLPFSLSKILHIEPSAGLRGTFWSVKPETDTGSGGDNQHSRGLYDLRVDLTSEFFNTFNVNFLGADRIKHTVLPEIEYEYVPNTDQQDLPEFDELDRIDPTNLLTYSITNFFITRSPVQKKQSADPDRYETTSFNYSQVGRFKLSQSYDVAEARQTDLPTGTEKRPFTPILAELDLSFNRYIRLDSDAAWNIYDDRLDSGNIAFILNDRRDDRLYTEYRYTRDSAESIYADLWINIVRSLGAGFEYERNLLSGERLKVGGKLEYRARCWSLSGRYLREPSDRKIEFRIELTGLGGLTGNL